eukprot:211827-Pyramimonas_sp.AAC.1
MRLPHPVHCFVAPEGAPPEVLVAHFAFVSRTQCSISWPQRELHRRSHWRSSHASPTPITALRGLRVSSNEGPRAQYKCVPPTQYSASWPQREFHR